MHFYTHIKIWVLFQIKWWSYALRPDPGHSVNYQTFLSSTVHCLNVLCFPAYAGDGLSNFQVEILLFPLHPPQLPPTRKKKRKKENKTPLSLPITPSLGEEAFLGGWTRVGGGETVVLVQGDSRVLQGSSQKEVRESGQTNINQNV